MTRLVLDPHAPYGAEVWRRPLPAALEEFADQELVDRHHGLAEKHEAAAQRVHELQALLRRAPHHDQDARREAHIAGDPVPEPIEPQVAAKLEDARRDLAALAQALPLSAQQIADTTADSLDDARTHAAEAVEERLRGVVDALDAVIDELHAAGQAIEEEEWLLGVIAGDQLGRSGRTLPFFPAGATRTSDLVREVNAVATSVEQLLTSRAEHARRILEDGDSHMTGATLPSYPGGVKHRMRMPSPVPRDDATQVAPPVAVPPAPVVEPRRGRGRRGDGVRR
jgi:hypothetical protein